MKPIRFLGRSLKTQYAPLIFRTGPLVCLIFLLMSTETFVPEKSLGAKIYKWIDKDGVIHFSDRKPENLDNVKGRIEERQFGEPEDALTGPKPTGKTAPRSPIEFAANCTFTIKGNGRLGSGFFLSPKGYAATCKHVIENTSAPTIILNDQTELSMKLIRTSNEHDLALILVILSEEVPYLRFRVPETLVPGERLFAIGSSVGLQATVTDGVFTGFREILLSQEKVIQFSAPINPGNSGGPLIDERGRVVGIVSSKYVAKQGIPVSGVGFAIPSSLLEKEFSGYIASKKE